MKIKQLLLVKLIFCFALSFGGLGLVQASDLLASWSDGKARQSVIDFVAKVTKASWPDFVPPAERIATFDNDGTLWSEQPMNVVKYQPGPESFRPRLFYVQKMQIH